MTKEEKQAIVDQALANYNAYEKNSILPALEKDPDAAKKQSIPLLKKQFNPSFRDAVRYEITREIYTGDKDARNVANGLVANVVHS